MTERFSIPDVRVLTFTALAALATGIGFGLAPALQATRLDQTSALKDGVSAPPRPPGGLDIAVPVALRHGLGG